MWGDLNGDGLPDIVGFNAATQTWAVLMSNSSGPWQQLSIAAPASQGNWSTVLAGDVNGDGRTELVSYDPSTGNWQMLAWSNGALNLQTIGQWDPGVTWSQVQLADINGDRVADVVGFNSQTNAWSVLSDISGRFVTTQIAWSAGTNYSNLSAGAVPGLSAATLRRQILAEIPTLSAALANSPLEAANLLLNWAANAADFAIDPQYLLQSAMSPADAYYNYFQTDVAGQSCGGFSWFYSEILKLFHIDSLDIGVGVNQSALTHSFVLIPEQLDGSWKFFVFDPTFNLTYSTPTSGYADYFELTSLEKAGQSSSVLVNQGVFPQRHFLAGSPQSANGQILLGVKNGTYVYSWANDGLSAFLHKWQTDLQQNGYAANLNGYLQFIGSDVLNVLSMSSDPSARNAFLSQLQSDGIPYSGN